MAMTAGALALGVYAVKASPALKALAITVGKGAAQLPGELAGTALSERARVYLNYRPSADSDSLRDLHASFGLRAAEDQLALFDIDGDRQALRRAVELLSEATDRLADADVQNDDKMWHHSIRVYHLLVTVAYVHASDIGRDQRKGLLFAERFLKRMFAMFNLKYKAARGALFNSDKKVKAVQEDYAVHMQVWVEQLFRAGEESGGRLAITTKTCTESGMVAEIELQHDVNPIHLVKCAQCPGGFLFGGMCSNPGCQAFVPPIGELASTAHGVHGLLAVQVDGKGEYWSRYAELAGGVLRLFESRGGPMVSQAAVPQGQTITVRAPNTARVGRPHCLRADLPVPDSTGQKKYIIDPTSADNRTRWEHALLGRALPPSLVAGALLGHPPQGPAPFPQPEDGTRPVEPEPEPVPAPEPEPEPVPAPEPGSELARVLSVGGTPVRWEWQETASGRWTPFSDFVISQIEAARAAGLRSVDVAAEHPGCYVDPGRVGKQPSMKSWDTPAVVMVRRLAVAAPVPAAVPLVVVADGSAAATAAELERQQQQAAIAAVSARIALEQKEHRRIEQERQRVADTKRAEKLREKIIAKGATLAYLRSDGQNTRVVEEEIDACTQELRALQRPGLPPNWEKAVDAAGRAYFIDHSTRQTHWDPPAGWRGDD